MRSSLKKHKCSPKTPSLKEHEYAFEIGNGGEKVLH
jgi:hypothetical protein